MEEKDKAYIYENGHHARKVQYPGPARNHIIPGAEHPQLDVQLKSGWMAGTLGSMSKKAMAIPPNDVEILRAKPRAVTSVK
jgi:hypothetical protein